MPKPCQVCARLDRADIDLQLIDPSCNVAGLARDLGVNRKALTSHRDQHTPSLLKAQQHIYGARADMPTKGQLHGELLRIYTAALDSLATAQAGVLVSVDDAGVEHRRISVTATSRAISEARKTLDRITSLAADAGDENNRPSGMATGELTGRIAAQLERMERRTLSPAADNDDVIDLVPLSRPLGPQETGGGLVVGTPPPYVYVDPLDAVKAPNPLPGLQDRPELLAVIEADAISTSHADDPASTATIYVPHPRWDGSPAASREERTAAGYPDVPVTFDDLKAAPAALVAALVAHHRSLAASPAAPE